MAKLYGKDYPSADKIWSRTSTIARSMASTLMPIVKPEDNISSWDDNKCVYCGGNANHLDHLYPLVENKYPSGYCTEPINLVPCCGNCNQSKGAKYWYDYMDITSYITVENLKKFIRRDIKTTKPEIPKDKLKNVLRVFDVVNLNNVISKSKLKKPIDKTTIDKLEYEKLLSVLKYETFIATLLDISLNNNEPFKDKLNNCCDCIVKDYRINTNHNWLDELLDRKLDGLVYVYLNYIINVSDSKELEPKEKIIYRLMKNRDTEKSDSVVGALSALNSRKNTLSDYCGKNNLPTASSDEKNNCNDHKLMFFKGTNEKDTDITSWWDKMYMTIKNSLDSAQIQIEAFNAGIKFAVNQETCFKCFFENLFEDPDIKNRLIEIGFILDKDDHCDISSSTDTAKGIYELAKDAFNRGLDYYKKNEKEQGIIKRLYYVEKK